MVKLNWMPFDYNPSVKVRALSALFTKALEKRLDPDYLCALAVDIGNCAPLGSNQTLLLLQELIDRDFRTANVWSAYAQALRIAGRIDEAVDATQCALTMAPLRSDLLTLMGKLYTETRRTEEAESLLRKAYEKSPGQAIVPLGEMLISQGKISEVGELIEATIERTGQSTATHALSSIYESHLGNRNMHSMRDSNSIVIFSPEEICRSEEIVSLNQEISECLLSHPALVFEPQSTATSKGRQAYIGDVLPEKLSKTVISIIQKQVEQVIGQMPIALPVDVQEKRASVVCWAVVLDDGGYQRPHIHPAGWLSGVYYVSVPETIDGLTEGGSIVFGELPESLAPDCSIPGSVFRPSSGQMILFPSYVYHSTVPHTGKIPRICLSFDVAFN